MGRRRVPNFVRFGSVLAVVLATLGGRVTDVTTGQPLVGVTVRVGSATAKTDGDGHFRLRSLKPGAATITLESNDVPATRFPIVVKRGANAHDFRACSTTLDFGCRRGADPESGSGAG